MAVAVLITPTIMTIDGELPNLIVHISDQEHVAMAPRPLKRTYAQLGEFLALAHNIHILTFF